MTKPANNTNIGNINNQTEPSLPNICPKPNIYRMAITTQVFDSYKSPDENSYSKYSIDGILKYKIPNFDDNRDVISRNEAQRFIVLYRDGNNFKWNKKPISHSLLSTIENVLIKTYFNAPLEGATRRRTFGENHSYPMDVEGSVDGDTLKVKVYRDGLACDPFEGSIRFGGTNTPESKHVGNFKKQRSAVVHKLTQDYNLLESDKAILTSIIDARMLYIGKIAALVSESFVDYVKTRHEKEIEKRITEGFAWRLEESFIRYVNPESNACDMLDMFDAFGRILGTVMLKNPDYITGFILNELPKTMSEAKVTTLYNNTMQVINDQDSWLTQLATRNENCKKLTNLLKNVPEPTEMYSLENCIKIAEAWEKLSLENKRQGDWNVAEIVMGISWAYSKYRNQNTDSYIKLSDYAEENKIGLWNDFVFEMINPLERGLNKNNGTFMAPRRPPDCLLEKQSLENQKMMR